MTNWFITQIFIKNLILVYIYHRYHTMRNIWYSEDSIKCNFMILSLNKPLNLFNLKNFLYADLQRIQNIYYAVIDGDIFSFLILITILIKI